eukprot:1156820-Pelagomonas_calceolata.AAC.3
MENESVDAQCLIQCPADAQIKYGMKAIQDIQRCTEVMNSMWFGRCSEEVLAKEFMYRKRKETTLAD